jgi:3-oxoacyl-[acyl-carrier-protein] synthase-3
MNDVYINKISVFLPNEPVTNKEMEDVLGKVNDQASRARRITLRNNGIKKRYYVIDKESKEIKYNNAELTAMAVRGLVDDNLSLEDIECLACGTSSPDQLAPNHTVMTLGELALNTEGIATAGICLSGLISLKYGYMAIKSECNNNIVATGSEVVSPMFMANHYEALSREKVDELEKNGRVAFEKDFLRFMLSDGAGAALLQDTPNKDGISLKIEWIDTISYAGEMPVCMYQGGKIENNKFISWKQFDKEEIFDQNMFAVAQNAKLLNENIVEYTITKPLSEIIERRNLKVEDIDYFLPHYSSEYFRDKLYKGLEEIDFIISKEKWFTNLSYKGNTGSASIYIIIEELLNSGKLQRGEKLLCFVPESGRFSTGFMLLEVV